MFFSFIPHHIAPFGMTLVLCFDVGAQWYNSKLLSLLAYSEPFTDGATLLAAADRMGLEGIVSRSAKAPYRSGPRCDWIKTKPPSWREANRERWRLFERH
jgi:hypothetical protein